MLGRSVLLAVFVLAFSGVVVATCGMTYAPQDAHISIEADSRSLLAYDEATDLERYVLQPAFTTDVDDFGVVVPTPSRPVLERREEDLFDEIDAITAPDDDPLLPIIGSSDGPDGVRVVDRTAVGDFDATVLEADSAKSLLQWLNRHGYDIDNSSTQNFRFYVDRGGYYFTALQVNATRFTCDGGQCSGRLTPVEFRFRTDTPYVPLRILRRNHTGASDDHLQFRLYALSDQPLIVEGATVDYANVIDDDRLGNYSAAGRFLVSQRYRVNPATVSDDLALQDAELFHIGSGEHAVVNPYPGERSGIVSYDGSGNFRKRGANMRVSTGTDTGLLDRAIFILEAAIPII